MFFGSVILFGITISIGIVFYLTKNHRFSLNQSHLAKPNTVTTPPEAPFNAYSIPRLPNFEYQTSPISIKEVLQENDTYTAYLFSFQTLHKTMTGQINIPHSLTNAITANQTIPVIVLLRGYVPLEIYQTGVGTKNAAAVFAEHGYVTLAPDFFGYGQSDPEPENSWEARFVKPINVIELIRSIQTQYFQVAAETKDNSIPDENQKKIVEQINTQQLFQLKKQLKIISENKKTIGMWAHSNGGQIALTVLEASNETIPTTLWAPVTAPFPYSILFFSDEHDDEGKAMRKWLSQFENEYDVFDFSITQHLDQLKSPFQIHHGSADEAALQDWSDEFIDKLEEENVRRKEQKRSNESPEIDVTETSLEPIKYVYHTYPGADHNMKPVWNTVIERDLQFFEKNLEK